MNDFETISVVHDGAVDWLTLNRPECLNALNGTMIRELWAYFDGLQSDYSRRVVVIRGAGKGFCSGLDLAWFSQAGAGGIPLGPTETGPGPSLPGVILKMRSCPQAIVALVHGAACGGGFNIALAADVRIAGRTAKMNVTYVKLGLSGCELGTSYFLPRMLGSSVAAELMMTGRFIRADRALATGLVSEVVDDDQLESVGKALVADLLAASPMGLRMTKEIMGRASEMQDLAAVISLEERTQMSCMAAGPFGQKVAAQPASKTDRKQS